MTSFISSLLIDLGIRTRPRPPHSDQAETPQPQTIPATSGHPDPTLSTSQHSGDSESASGNAASLPAPPFFTTLPKEMDGLSSDPEGVRIMPEGPLPSDALATARHTADIVHAADVDVDIRGPADLESGRREVAEPPITNPRLRSDGAGRSLNPAFNLAEASPMSLPADDGMGWLRKKIHAIRELDSSNDDKARMVHDLMTESYNSCRTLSPNLAATLSPTLSTSRLVQLGSWPTPRSDGLPDLASLSPTLTASISQYEHQFTLTSEDLQPSYVPKVEPESPVVETGEETGKEDQDTEELEETSFGCQHYHRNVKVECFTCKKWYTCRFCHDEVEDHHLIRRDIENMLCMLCGHAQPAAHDCRKCGVQTAQYFCEICKFWDNDGNKSIYHCNDCGICRIGQGLGKDFFHCKTCSVCLPISIEDTHRCIERSTQCDCPICGDYMFDSPETVVVMRCGHSLHHKCLSEYSKTSFRCPICSKTITNMESTFRNLDRTIESQPMPEEFKDTKGLIYCNDCGARSAVKYHWLGLKCDLCESYNTAQLRVLQGDISEALEEESVRDLPHRPRSSSLNVTGDATASLASLHLSASQVTQAQLSVPGAAGSDRQFVSYNMTHGRAISPVVSNYFGLPTERESEKPSSMPFFGGASQDSSGGDYGALNFLSKKLRDRYGFLAGETALTGGTSEAEDEDDDAGSGNSSESDEEDGGEDSEEEDEGIEHIDIFGHR